MSLGKAFIVVLGNRGIVVELTELQLNHHLYGGETVDLKGIVIRHVERGAWSDVVDEQAQLAEPPKKLPAGRGK